MTFSFDKSYGDITGPRAFRFGRGGRLDLAIANSQSTVDRDAAELLVLAEIRGRINDGIRRPVAQEWDDGAGELEWLAAEDWNPKRSIMAAGGAERWTPVLHPHTGS